jgi:glycosyltransferase involved in cell wall biosynthesis
MSQFSGRKLLFVINNPDFFVSHRLQLAVEAVRRGFEVHLACPEQGRTEFFRNLGVTLHPLPLDRSKARPWKELASLAKIVSLYRRLRPDIVHHVTIKPVIYGTLAARAAGVPCVVNAVSGLGYVFIAKGLKARLVRMAVKLAYRLSLLHPDQRIIFQNPDDREIFLAGGMARAADSVIIKGSGVDTREYAPEPEPPGPEIVLLPARLLRDKGVGEFVAAARQLRAEGFRARFALAGDVDPGNPASVTREWVREAGEAAGVEWWGHVADMPAAYARVHLVCLPSYREGLPKTLIEAASCGRAIVATDVPGCREIVRHLENGILVEAKNPAALADGLRALLRDAELRRRMGASGRRMVEAEFSLDRVVDATMKIYGELLASRGRRRASAAGATRAFELGKT